MARTLQENKRRFYKNIWKELFIGGKIKMASKNEITISLDEYKELLLKDKPNNKDTMLLERIKELLLEHIKYEKDWDDNIKIDFKYDSKFCDELITVIKVVDKEFYKDMMKHVCDEKAKKDAEKAKMEKARAIKNIDKE